MAATDRKSSQGRGKSSSGSMEIVEKPRTTTVSVDDSETWVEQKRFTVYKVVVKLQGRAFFLFRRLEIIKIYFLAKLLLQLSLAM